MELKSCIQKFQEVNLTTHPTKSDYIQLCLRTSNSEGNLTVMVDDIEIKEQESIDFLEIHLTKG